MLVIIAKVRAMSEATDNSRHHDRKITDGDSNQ